MCRALLDTPGETSIFKTLSNTEEWFFVWLQVERRGFKVTREELPDVRRGTDESATFGCCRSTDAVLYSGRR